MKKIIEIVPNYSEGKNKTIMDQIIAPFQARKEITLVSLEMDASYHRSVVTVIGEVDAVLDAMVESAMIAAALIDLRIHKGEHKRMGAVDVVPLIPILNVEEKECLIFAEDLAKRIHEATKIPVFLYNRSAKQENRVNLPDIRKGEFEGMKEKIQQKEWYPDFGEPQIHESAGVVAVGVRLPLIAFNIDLASTSKEIATAIAKRIRFSGGGYRFIQAGPAFLADRGHVQVTMNITDASKTSIYQAFEATKMEAKRYGVTITSCEIVGLVSKEYLLDSLKYYLQMGENEILELPLSEIVAQLKRHIQLRDFDERKIIEYYV